MLPTTAFRRLTDFLVKVIEGTVARAPDWKYEAFEEIARPFLDDPEVQEIMFSLKITRAEMVQKLLDEEEEILTAGSFHALVRLRPQDWLHDLGSSFSEEIGRINEISIRGIFFGFGVVFSVILSVVISPSLVFLYPLLFVAGLVSLYLLSGGNHRGMRFVDPFLGDLRNSVVTPLLRAHLNDLLWKSGMDEPFQITGASSLVDLSDRKQIVATKAMAVIERASSSVGAGSIGVSGPRGAGKTTLLRSFCENRFAQASRPDLRILIPAPVHYEARDFAIHIFSHLCEAVIANVKKKPKRSFLKFPFALLEYTLFPLGIIFLFYAFLSSFLAPTGSLPTIDDLLSKRHLVTLEKILLWGEHVAIYFALPAVVLFAVSLFFGVQFIGFLRKKFPGVERVQRVDLWEAIAPMVLAVVVAVVTILTVAQWVGAPKGRFDYLMLWTPYTPGVLLLAASFLFSLCGAALSAWYKRENADPPKDLVSLARERLRQLRYLETTTIGLTGSLQAARPVQLSGSRTQALAEQQMGLPQLVAEYRNFATLTADWWNELHKGRGRLVIGIDEIDKMSAQEAEQFINQVKALFGTPNCLTLVSVSDDALANFDQRSFSVRDSFDTAFDDIVRVEPLSYEDVRQLLVRRISGIPDPLVALCYVLSGGLPRECLRVARRLVQLRVEGQSAVAEKVISPVKNIDFVENLIRQEVGILKTAIIAQGFPVETKLGGEKSGVNIDSDIRGFFQSDWPDITGDKLLEVGFRWWGVGGDMAVYAAQFLFLGAVLVLYTDVADNRPIGVLLREWDADAIMLLDTLARARAVGVQSSKAQKLLVEEFLENWGWEFDNFQRV